MAEHSWSKSGPASIPPLELLDDELEEAALEIDDEVPPAPEVLPAVVDPLEEAATDAEEEVAPTLVPLGAPELDVANDDDTVDELPDEELDVVPEEVVVSLDPDVASARPPESDPEVPVEVVRPDEASPVPRELELAELEVTPEDADSQTPCPVHVAPDEPQSESTAHCTSQLPVSDPVGVTHTPAAQGGYYCKFLSDRPLRDSFPHHLGGERLPRCRRPKNQ